MAAMVQVTRGMAFNKDSTLLVFGSEDNATIERDYKLTSLTPLSWPNGPAGQIKLPAAISSFVF